MTDASHEYALSLLPDDEARQIIRCRRTAVGNHDELEMDHGTDEADTAGMRLPVQNVSRLVGG